MRLLMLIDDVVIKIQAGNGGRGAVAFNKNKMSLGPAGGSGGKGGDVYVEGVADLSALNRFRHVKVLAAKNGENGKSQFNDGADGGDLILNIPVGTVVHNPALNTHTEILKIGERVLVAQGGHGGKGNFLFRSPVNTSPKEFQEGTAGEQFDLRLELKLIADVGLIGLPNVGKSSLLNALTNAKSKVANYLFTTLEPNLGVYYELVLADIPGLIEGASTGKGLGTKFLRHIERTKVLFHLIAADSADPIADYTTIRKELGAHNQELLNKKEYVFLSKTDTVPEETVKEKIALLRKHASEVYILSVQNKEGLVSVRKILTTLIEEKHVPPAIQE